MQSQQSLIFLPELDLAEAEQGDLEAQYRVGLYHREQKNYAEAIKWLQKAGDQNHAESLYTLAMVYETGEGNVAQDAVRALKLYRKVAEQGHTEAQNKMMALYSLIMPAQHQSPVLLVRPVILSKPITVINTHTSSSLHVIKSPKIIYKKHTETAIAEFSSDDSDDDSRSSYAQTPQTMWSTKTTYDPNAWARSQLKSSMQTNAWHRKMNNW